MISDEEVKEEQQEGPAGGSEGTEEHHEELPSEEHTPVTDLETELSQANDKYLRLYSEFENFRRRTAREKLDMISTASMDVIRELLPVLDDFERAQQINEKIDDPAAKAALEGYALVYQKMFSILTSKGLKKMDALGKPFDVELHEAMTKIPVKSKKEKGKVVDVIESGYLMGDKVVRFAKVVIGE
jgi:molecular chaperone GrpE